ncbi:NAD-dependent malic enzyme [bacterium]|nr:NAD-dependent malic enzyme [bacterium]
MNYNEEAIIRHTKWHGKIEIKSRVQLENKDDLSVAYTPGVAEPCRRIHENIDDVFKYTRKGNLVAIVTDGTAVLGLGDIGPEAGMPVMEGKAILFKEFGKVDAFPICLATKNVDEIVETVCNIAPTFGGINLEDISAPRCFEIEERLIEKLDIPVFHDDQHGTAIVTLAALLNANKITGRKFENLKIVMNGAGAAGIAITKLLQLVGATNVIIVDSKGIVSKSRDNLNDTKQKMLDSTNPDNLTGGLEEAVRDADIFIGVSLAGLLSQEMVRSMAKDPIILAMANPDPEIMPHEAKAAGARIVGTGRSDFPNQVNNVLGFPGIFRGALDVRARKIDNSMKIAAAKALANCVTDEQLCEEFIIPNPLDKSVAMNVAAAVADAAVKAGLARA